MSKEEGCEGRGVNGCVIETLVLRFIWLVDDNLRRTNRAVLFCTAFLRQPIGLKLNGALGNVLPMLEDSSRRWLPLSVSTQPSANPV